MKSSKAKWTEKLMLVFSDKAMFLWLLMAVTGLVTFRHDKLIGALLCLPAIVFYAMAFGLLAIANRTLPKKSPKN